jgi:hypothetical protein
MSLDVAKLEKVRELAGGIVQARCPACAEGGNDRSGEHLRIYADGRFGCCVHPKDGDHRKRIWVLAGARKPGNFSLRLKSPPAMPVPMSVKMVLSVFDRGTLGTGKSESVCPVTHDSRQADLKIFESGTLGTGIVELRARAREDCLTPNTDKQDFHEQLEDLASPVPSVPTAGVVEPPVLPDGHHERRPLLTAGGDLSIPFDSPERYHWWKPDGERLTVAETLVEVKEWIKNAVTL